jgi:hypothetical protein
MPWRRQTDPRKMAIHAEIDRLLNEATASGGAGRIVIEPIPYWPNGLGNFEAARTVKLDLSKLTSPQKGVR